MSMYFKKLTNYYSYTFLLKTSFLIAVLITIIDYLNLPSIYLGILNVRVVALIIVGLIFVAILLSIELHLFDIFKLVSINIIDMLSMVAIFTITIYSIAAVVLGVFHQYKIISITVFAIIAVSILIKRKRNFEERFAQQEEFKTNVIDFKRIYENDFEIKYEIPILIEEKDVDYDLLERSRTINLLYTSILNTNPTNSFVISLEGKWGSGKTTLINNTKNLLVEHEDIIIIDDLDPWTYETTESLFNSMFEKILNQSNINFNSFETTQIINKTYSEIFANKKINVLKNILFPSENLSSIKDKINEQLKLSNKKVVFFIDNIDRTDKENIILLFKLVSNILDFERIIYILSFDNERVKKVFENELNIEYEYLKKIIQMQIRVPQIDKQNYHKLFETSFHNILIKYGESPENLSKTFSSLIYFIAKNTSDLRDFKRFINSALSFSYKTITFLNKRDLLTLEYVRLNNINLYEKIFNNPNFFVSHDREINMLENMTSLINREGFNKEAKIFFNNLFGDSENEKYKELLGSVFPFVDKYIRNQDLIPPYGDYGNNTYEDIVKSKNICSQKFFSLYFDYTSNEYVLIGEILEEFINEVNSGSNDIEANYIKLLRETLKSYQHKEFMERLQFYLNDFVDISISELVKSIYNNLCLIDSYQGFMSLSGRTRATIIIWNLLQKLSEEEYNMFINNIKRDYKNLIYLKEILYWFEHDNENININGRKEKFQSAYGQCVESLIRNEIDIYSESYYQVGNILSLATYYEENLDIVKQYIEKIINKNNIFRFLYDITSTSAGSQGVRYYILFENLRKFTNEEYISIILEEVAPSFYDESIVLEIYTNHLVESNYDSMRDIGLRVPDYLNLQL